MVALMSTQTTLIVVALMAALSIVAISTLVDTALAVGKPPPGTPRPGIGTPTGKCAHGSQGPTAATCAPTFRGP